MEWNYVLVAVYFFIAGMHAEFNHNYTCNMKLSIIAALIWPLFLFLKKPKGMPKYYRDGHYKKDLDKPNK